MDFVALSRPLVQCSPRLVNLRREPHLYRLAVMSQGSTYISLALIFECFGQWIRECVQGL